MDCHINALTVTREMFVHGIVEHFAHAMMQGPFVRPTDIHARLLADGFQPFELTELRCAVIRLPCRVGGAVGSTVTSDSFAIN